MLEGMDTRIDSHLIKVAKEVRRVDLALKPPLPDQGGATSANCSPFGERTVFRGKQPPANRNKSQMRALRGALAQVGHARMPGSHGG